MFSNRCCDSWFDGVLQRTIRAHGNFIEYVPIDLLFLVVLEWMQARSGLLWMLGATLILAQIAHARGMVRTYGPFPHGRSASSVRGWFTSLAGGVSILQLAALLNWDGKRQF